MSETILDLPGAFNLRDFGGWATVDGRRVRRGRLFRSGTLARLTADAQCALLELGIATICDLRRGREAEREPTPFAGARPRMVSIPIDAGHAGSLREHLTTHTRTIQDGIDYMVGINRQLASDHEAEFARMFQALIQGDDGGFLVHCSAGKDRTGFGAAIILRALGVPSDRTLDGYEFSNVAMDVEGLLPRLASRWPELDPAIAATICGVRRAYLQAGFDAVDARHGDFDTYLREGLGVSDVDRHRLQARLLED
ncbi:MAG: tyrosine-protein phosphatase [Gammaproteobacteria bacterium]